MLYSVSWEDAFEKLRKIRGRYYIAFAINDMPEAFRMKVIKQFKYEHSITVENILTNIQIYRKKYDAKSVFPVVATDAFLRTLPASAQRCNFCSRRFQILEDMHWKYCKKHAIHSRCLRNLWLSHENPLYGPCDCNTEGYGLDSKWKREMPDSKTRREKEVKIKTPDWVTYRGGDNTMMDEFTEYEENDSDASEPEDFSPNPHNGSAVDAKVDDLSTKFAAL